MLRIISNSFEAIILAEYKLCYLKNKVLKQSHKKAEM